MSENVDEGSKVFSPIPRKENGPDPLNVAFDELVYIDFRVAIGDRDFESLMRWVREGDEEAIAKRDDMIKRRRKTGSMLSEEELQSKANSTVKMDSEKYTTFLRDFENQRILAKEERKLKPKK